MCFIEVLFIWTNWISINRNNLSVIEHWTVLETASLDFSDGGQLLILADGLRDSRRKGADVYELSAPDVLEQSLVNEEGGNIEQMFGVLYRSTSTPLPTFLHYWHWRNANYCRTTTAACLFENWCFVAFLMQTWWVDLLTSPHPLRLSASPQELVCGYLSYFFCFVLSVCKLMLSLYC